MEHVRGVLLLYRKKYSAGIENLSKEVIAPALSMPHISTLYSQGAVVRTPVSANLELNI